MTEHGEGAIEGSATHHLTPAIARGDGAAFGAFYDAWFDRCHVFARRLTRRDESFCLDVVQEVMLRVARRMRALPDEAAVRRWMLRAVSRAAIDALRAEARRRQREQVAARVEADVPGEFAEERERQAWVARALDELDPRERALLAARFEAGATLAAAGAAVGLGGDAAHGRIRRTLGRLREAARRMFDE